MIICIVGKTGSGKSTIARALTNLYKAEYVEISQLVKRFAPQCASRSVLQNVHRKQSDPNWLATPFLRIVHSAINDDGNVIISGIREPYLIASLEATYPDERIIVFEVVASLYERYARCLSRDDRKVLSVEDFREYDNGDKNLGLDIVLERVDYQVSGTIEETVSRIELILFECGLRSARKLGGE